MKIKIHPQTNKLCITLANGEEPNEYDLSNEIFNFINDDLLDRINSLQEGHNRLGEIVAAQHKVIVALSDLVKSLSFMAQDLADTAAFIPKHDHNFKRVVKEYEELLEKDNGTSAIDR